MTHRGQKDKPSTTYKLKTEPNDLQRHEIKAVFDFFDPQKSNRIDVQELSTIMKALRINANEAMIQKAKLEIDPLRRQHFGFEEFQRYMSKEIIKIRPDSHEQINQIYQYCFDKELKGITLESIMKKVRESGFEMKEEQLELMIENASGTDDDQQATVSLPQFLNLMMRTGLF